MGAQLQKLTEQLQFKVYTKYNPVNPEAVPLSTFYGWKFQSKMKNREEPGGITVKTTPFGGLAVFKEPFSFKKPHP